MAQHLQGFLLTRHWQDTPKGIDLEYWASTKSGAVRLLFSAQEAVCFIERSCSLQQPMLPSQAARRRELALKTLQGKDVDALYWKGQRAFQAWKEQAEGASVLLFESDIRAVDRFLMERFIHGGFEVYGEPRHRSGFREYVNPAIKAVDYRPELRWLSLDIETSDLSGGQLYSIAVLGSDIQRTWLVSEQEVDGTEVFGDEAALLKAFFTFIADYDPDLIIGWNIIGFDLMWLQACCRRHGIRFDLGRAGESAAILPPRNDDQPPVARIPGRVVLDGIDLLKAAFWQFESFDLETVAQQLLGRGKTVTEGVEALRCLYRENPQRLLAYNLEDCRLVAEIFEKAGLFEFAVERARITGLPMDRLGGSVAAFDFRYLPRLHRKGRVGPDLGAKSPIRSPGGYVMDSRPGFYENVLVLDFKSLYPSIIRTFKVDPLGLALPDVDEDVMGFLNARFHRDEHILPDLIAELWQERELARTASNRALTQAIKIVMNSFYGVLGSPGCRFFDPRLASSITRRGHEIITRSREFLEEQGVSVIYGDTDSLFVLLGEGVSRDEAQETGTRLMNAMNDWWRTTLQQEQSLKSYLEIEFETHYLKFFMPTIRGTDTGSKKRYAGSVADGDGIRMVFKGLESVRTDWTPLARRFQEEIFLRVFTGKEVGDHIRNIVTDLRAGRLDHELAYRKRLRRRIEEYVHQIPPHVQAARQQKNPGRWVEYLITLQGPQPLEALSSVPDYDHYLDRQLAPAVDGLLQHLGTSFEDLAGVQMTMF